MPPADPPPPEPPHRAAEREARALAALVRGEAERGRLEASIRPDPARLEAGWERRFVIEAGRAADLIRLYESLGQEVCADPVEAAQVDPACGDCRLLSLLQYVTIYTRWPAARDAPAARRTPTDSSRT